MLHNFTLHNFKVSGVMFNIDFLCSFLLYVESLPFSLSPPAPRQIHYIISFMRHIYISSMSAAITYLYIYFESLLHSLRFR